MFRVLNFRSDVLRTKETKFGSHENFPPYGIDYARDLLTIHAMII